MSNVEANTVGIGMTVVCYYRMSTDEQDASIEQQRNACRAHCKRNRWLMAEEYIDEGKSGSKNKHLRTDFLRMLDECDGVKYSAIVVWNTSRFSREDSTYINDDIKTLRAAGVHIESVQEGKIDPAVRMGRMMLMMYAEGNNECVTKLAADSVRGRHDRVREGYWPHGLIPVGYDRQYWFDGVLQNTLPRNAKAAKARGWRIKLVVNEVEAAVVRWVYETWVNRDVSLVSLARELHGKGLTSSKGATRWTAETVGDLLRQPAYKGVIAAGHNERRAKVKGFSKVKKVENVGGCPEIVTTELWQQAVTKLKLLQTAGKGRPKRDLLSGALSGIAFCGHCGGKMAKGISDGTTRYVCTTKSNKPDMPPCPGRTIHEAQLLPRICEEVANAVDMDILTELRAKPREVVQAQLEPMRRQAAELTKRINKGEANLLLADDAELFKSLGKVLNGWKAERQKLVNTIELAEGRDAQGEAARFIEWWRANAAALVTIKEPEPMPSVLTATEYAKLPAEPMTREVVQRYAGIVGEPEVVRAVLLRLGVRVYVYWRKRSGGYYSYLDYAKVILPRDPTGGPVDVGTIQGAAEDCVDPARNTP